jgi:hypothetical protein
LDQKLAPSRPGGRAARTLLVGQSGEPRERPLLYQHVLRRCALGEPQDRELAKPRVEFQPLERSPVGVVVRDDQRGRVRFHPADVHVLKRRREPPHHFRDVSLIGIGEASHDRYSLVSVRV